jgi:hypothetical protein
MNKLKLYVNNYGCALGWTYFLYVFCTYILLSVLNIRNITLKEFFKGFDDFEIFMACVVVTHFLFVLYLTYLYLKEKFK